MPCLNYRKGVCPSACVCVSVCPSRLGTVSKRRNLESRDLHCRYTFQLTPKSTTLDDLKPFWAAVYSRSLARPMQNNIIIAEHNDKKITDIYCIIFLSSYRLQLVREIDGICATSNKSRKQEGSKRIVCMISNIIFLVIFVWTSLAG